MYKVKKKAEFSISFLTTCQNRLWQLQQTLELSIKNSLSYTKHVEFVLLNYYSEDELDSYVHTLKTHVDSGKLVYINAQNIEHREDTVTFNRSIAKNMVAKYASCDILCWLDADNIVLPWFCEYLNDCFCFNQDIVLQGDFRIAHDVGGRIACMRSDFEKSHKYNENLVGYNHEDIKLVSMLVDTLDLKRLFIHKQFLINSWVSNKKSILCKNLNFSIINKIYILVIFYNCAQYLHECIQSIVKQDYKNLEVIVYDDGSTDNSKEICEYYCTTQSNFYYFKNDNNEGPASARFNGFNIIRNKLQSLNDIVLQIDGDDYLCNKDALNIINHTYNLHKPNITFGSMLGKFSNGTQNYEMPDDFKSQWLYDHPRSFISYFLKEFDISLFTMDNKYLKRYTDRLFIYHVLERSGRKKTKKIQSELYYYRSHNNNLHKNPIKEHKDMFDYVQKFKRKTIMDDIIHVIVCSYKRLSVLPNFIKQLNTQKMENKMLVHIICNDTITYNWYINNSHIFKFDYSITLYENTNYGFERFLHIKNILFKNYLIPYIIILDDDLIFDCNFVQSLYNLKTPRHYICTYVKVFNDRRYWCEIDVTQNFFDYGGTGGCILDTNIFKNENLYKYEDDSILYIEDLWLSYIIQNTPGWVIKNSHLPMQLAKSENMLSSTIKPHKQKLFEKLIDKSS